MPKVVIVTALELEFRAVARHVQASTEVTHSTGAVYEQGVFEGNVQKWDVLLVQSGMGNTAAALSTARAMEFFGPDVLLFVGVAGGIKDVQLGDVVAASVIYGYEKGKQDICRQR